MTQATIQDRRTKKRRPAWAVMLAWLLERGAGLTVLEIVSRPREGRLFGASYRQRITDLRRWLGDSAILTESETMPDGQVQTRYHLNFLYETAAQELLENGPPRTDSPRRHRGHGERREDGEGP